MEPNSNPSKETTSQAANEKFAWDNNQVKRDKYTQTFSHSPYYSDLLEKKIKAFFKKAEGKVLLEIGSNAWIDYVYKFNFKPTKIVCLNISIEEIKLGLNFLKSNPVDYPVEFVLCDGSQLPFLDQSFEIVFGGAILHHLAFNPALKEISRVCKPNGEILFHEPLGVNPIANLIRLTTPFARTQDETPLTLSNLSFVNNYFNCKCIYSQFGSVLSSLISNYLGLKSYNKLNKVIFYLDELLLKLIPKIQYFYREILIIGYRKG